ncbi:response regulator with CheY-like receiver [Idiomarina sp. A28L]|uniref:response regulator n=1 Tax=Idiomarina sp. A28L TaxID=1036674 RepID=UPI0002138D5E|nr:response regulator [Idiomarina sp. A28L]EGN74667.1 response regulator with CheY-like receiver [Idiomarina sp. A28L]
MSRKILIIEDDPIYASLLTNYLLDRGFDVFNATTGKEAIESLSKVKPNVVLCDLELPDISGLTILENILKSVDAVPVIVISASDDLRDIRAAVRLGAVDYLVKPVQQLDVLEYAIENCLTRKNLEISYEQERWELDHHLDVIFNDHSMVSRLAQDLAPHEHLRVGPVLVDHELGLNDCEKVWIDYYRLPDNQIIMLLARAQAMTGQDVVALLVLKTLFNPILRSGLSGNMQLLRNPNLLLSRLNNELCHSRIRAAFDVVCASINPETKEIRWSQAGDKIMLSHEGHPDLAMGIWAKASYRCHTTELDRSGFYIACDNTWLRASLN